MARIIVNVCDRCKKQEPNVSDDPNAKQWTDVQLHSAGKTEGLIVCPDCADACVAFIKQP